MEILLHLKKIKEFTNILRKLNEIIDGSELIINVIQGKKVENNIFNQAEIKLLKTMKFKTDDHIDIDKFLDFFLEFNLNSDKYPTIGAELNLYLTKIISNISPYYYWKLEDDLWEIAKELPCPRIMLFYYVFENDVMMFEYHSGRSLFDITIKTIEKKEIPIRITSNIDALIILNGIKKTIIENNYNIPPIFGIKDGEVYIK